MTTEERILDSAVALFSRKGYKNTSIKEIARKAQVNSLTVFRYFHDKDTLFFQAVGRMKQHTFSPEQLDERLTFRDVAEDLMVIGRAYVDEICASLPLIRIYIGEGSNFDQLKEERWFISPALKAHFSAYVRALDCAAPSAGAHADLLAELFISHITRKVMSGSKYESAWKKPAELNAALHGELQSLAKCVAFMIGQN